MRKQKTYHAPAKSDRENSSFNYFPRPKRKQNIWEKEKKLFTIPKIWQIWNRRGLHTLVWSASLVNSTKNAFNTCKKKKNFFSRRPSTTALSSHHTRSPLFHLTNTNHWICFLTVFFRSQYFFLLWLWQNTYIQWVYTTPKCYLGQN